MPAPLTICVDLTPCEMKDRFGGFGRYGRTLVRHLLALPPDETAGLNILALPRSNGRPVPAGAVLETGHPDEPLISSWRHHQQRRLLVGGTLRAAKVDLFHTITPAALPFQVPCPVIATVHDIIPVVCPEPGRGPVARYRRVRDRLQQRLRLRRIDHVLAISDTTKQDLVRAFGLARDRISVVHHGVDTTVFTTVSDPEERARIRARHHLPDRWILSVGSDHYRKNQERLFEAWRQVSTSIDTDLVFVGKAIHDGTLGRVTAAARRAGLADRVRWLADIGDADLPALYRGAAVLVAPSLYEGFGMTLLEGMACGTPVLAARTDAHAEVAGDAATYFDPVSVDALAAALVRITQDDILARDLRIRGLERARTFTWRNAASETVTLYRRLAGRPRNRPDLRSDV